MPTYTSVRSVESNREYEALATDRRGLVDRAIGILANDPFNPTGTVDIGHGSRIAHVSDGLTIRYGTHKHYLVIAEISDTRNSGYLLGG